MNGIYSQLAMLQYGDSFFPSGAVSFSWGLEGLVECGGVSDAASLSTFVKGQLRSRWVSYDRVIIAAAHEASGDADAVATIDGLVEATTLAAELRNASCRMGAAMLLVFARLGHERAVHYRSLVARDAAHGHLTVMQGMLWASVGLSAEESMALSAHGFCTGLLSAAVRLGCITHLDAQRILHTSRAEAGRLAQTPLPPLSDISTHAVEAEITTIQHASRDLRLFAN